MQTKNQYEPFTQKQYYIDKTEALEKGITVFPSIYIEGAAASGKTTAVRMLLAKHPEVKHTCLRMREILQESSPEMFHNVLTELGEEMESRAKAWIVFEDIPGTLPGEIADEIAGFIQHMPANGKVILTGRERLPERFLELLWKRQMERIPQAVLLFTRDEIRNMIEQSGSPLDAEELYGETGGWAGCVDLMIRLSSEAARGGETADTESIRMCYEVDEYIQREILDSLSGEEQEIMRRAAICPWLDEDLCREVWGLFHAEEYLEELAKKGILTYDKEKNRWKTAALFVRNYCDGNPENRRLCRNNPKLPGDAGQEGQQQETQAGMWRYLGKWYSANGYIKEALQCLRKTGDKKAYQASVTEHYNEIPFLEMSFAEVMEWKENTPELCYLRGMYCYSRQNIEGMEREIRRLERLHNREAYLNLLYVKPDLGLDDWLALLEESVKEGEPFRLYGILGNSFSYLCGLRDLSGLFACTKKEERRKARIWKECLGETEWMGYQFARLDYYLETEQTDSVPEEDWELLSRETELTLRQEPWQLRWGRFYLLCKLQSIQPERENRERIARLGASLLSEESEVCVRNTEAVMNLYSTWLGEREKLARWLRHADTAAKSHIGEENYAMLCCRSKGYLLLNQYEKAEKLIRKEIPYLQCYRRFRLQAEMTFQQAVASWGEGRRSQALKSVIESFLINGESRYVRFYTAYGKLGMEVLEAYAEWMRNSTPGGWRRKKSITMEMYCGCLWRIT